MQPGPDIGLSCLVTFFGLLGCFGVIGSQDVWVSALHEISVTRHVRISHDVVVIVLASKSSHDTSRAGYSRYKHDFSRLVQCSFPCQISFVNRVFQLFFASDRIARQGLC